jgi:uncharacterized coiled-coil protein SlyX
MTIKDFILGKKPKKSIEELNQIITDAKIENERLKVKLEAAKLLKEQKSLQAQIKAAESSIF